MRNSVLFLFIFSLLLVACSSQPTPTTNVSTEAPPQPTQVDPTEAPPEPTEASADPTSPPEETAPPTDATTASGPSVFQIVPNESQLKYEVGEVFLNQGNKFNVAVGITRQISGEISIDPEAIQETTLGPVTADISQFKSDSNRRDNALRDRFIESAKYPNVTFTATQIDGLTETYQDGQEIQLTIQGDLTIREETKPVSFEAVVKHEGGTLSGVATTTILMSEFDFGPIDIAGILKTEDEAKVTLTFVARP